MVKKFGGSILTEIVDGLWIAVSSTPKVFFLFLLR